MNKRLHEKKRVGELKELGFELLGYLRPGTSFDSADAAAQERTFMARSNIGAFSGRQASSRLTPPGWASV
ncbi:hypothetical protein P2318_08130 [Myxococcaceae bacterium GXIMD 01537]